MPAPDESVDGVFDCEKSTVVLTGWFRPPSGCHRLVFESFETHPDTNEATIRLTSRWASERPQSEVNCGGVTYKYQAELVFDRTVPETMRVEYESPDGNVVNSFEVHDDSC